MKGVPIGFIYNGTQYFYITNQMGDVIGITDSTGTLIAQYEYDEWGNVLSTSENDIANTNPIRYRGYYQDAETGYYYLQSRYYDASIYRFINADVPEIAKMSKDIPVGTNLFAYCSNNPVNNSDPSGKGALQTILNVLGKSIDILIKIVDYIVHSCNFSIKKLENKAKMYTKARNQKNALKEVVKESESLSKKLGRVGKIITAFAITVGVISAIRSGSHWSLVIVQLLVEAITEGISAGISAICRQLGKLVPGVGFIVGVVASVSASILLSRYFTDSRNKRIASSVWGDIKGHKITSVNYLFEVTFKKAFA